jgi:hypothetical protein
VAPISPDSPDPSVDGSFFNFLGATSEDTVFNHDVYVHGTLFADKIKANEIEGLSIFTDQLASLQQKLAGNSALAGSPTGINNGALGGLNMKMATISQDLNVGGGLVVGGDAEFRGNVIFTKLVSFVEKTVFKNDISFEGRATFNNDSAGYAVIHQSQQEVEVKFDKPYQQPPVIVVSISNGKFVQYSYKDLTEKGFKIILAYPADDEINFAWVAMSIKDPRTTEVPLLPSNGPVINLISSFRS